MPFLPSCEKLILNGNPIIYYTEEIKNRFKLPDSPMTEMVNDYLDIKNKLIGMLDITVKKEDRIEYLFEAYFKSEKNFIGHLKKLLLNFNKFDMDKSFEKDLREIISIFKFKNKYIKYKLKYYKLKSKIGRNVKS